MNSSAKDTPAQNWITRWPISNWSRDPGKALTLVSNWALGRDESYALWKIYLYGKKRGIAIRTTVSRLRHSLERGGDPVSEDFYIGQVRYTSYLRDAQLTRFHVICTKKPFYSFESELRAFILHQTVTGASRAPYDVSSHRCVRVDLTTLLPTVYISPFADTSYGAEVHRLLTDAHLRPQVRLSAIRDA